ncbi:hypothetical protein VCHA37P192_20263 [Vibrio chagasii]|nr:hypothetical protein VCHA38O210_10126 [Vibrio chagasii]CAH7354901.1 hypothetical protein VCHA37P192_20263 [Vibrio chagasii]
MHSLDLVTISVLLVSNITEGNQYNKAFKSDSQRLAVSLRSSIAKRRSYLNVALYASAPLLIK